MPRVLRKTQEQRSTETRTRLLDAAIECLYEHGYARTTTVEICARAGLSRGAQLHHFPTKADLVTTAVEHLFEQRYREFKDAFARLPTGINKASAAIDLLWKILSGPSFYAWLEVCVAARTDPELKKTVEGITRRFSKTVEDTFREIFGRETRATPLHDVAPILSFALLQGLALDRIAIGDDPRINVAIERYKVLADLVIGPRTPEGGRAR